MSLPARGRGLKPTATQFWYLTSRLSLPARGRGLKLDAGPGDHERAAVAPRAGAWIDTLNVASWPRAARVAPRAGAWIETDTPDRERRPVRVAPRAGAWIETWRPSLPGCGYGVA